MTGFCQEHPAIGAVARCGRCQRAVCDQCAVAHGPRVVCNECAGPLRRQRWKAGVLSVLLTSIVLAGGVVYWLAYPSHRFPSVELPAAEPLATEEVERPPGPTVEETVVALEEALAAEPCDRPKALALAQLLLRKGDYRRSATYARDFCERCGEHRQLREVAFNAWKLLSAWDEAIADAGQIIEKHPTETDPWWWRGQVYEQSGELELAVADYRQALALQPQLAKVPFNLSMLLERLERPCEAISPVESFLYYHPDARPNPRIRALLGRLYGAGDCGEAAGTGRAVVEFDANDTLITTIVLINGRRARAAIDTGASYVMVSKRFAAGLDLKPASAHPIRIHGVGSVREASLVILDTVELQGLRAGRVEAVLMDEIDPRIDMLLGLTFLSRFTFELDKAAGRLELRARD